MAYLVTIVTCVCVFSERKNDQLADQEDELKQAKLTLQKFHHEVCNIHCVL